MPPVALLLFALVSAPTVFAGQPSITSSQILITNVQPWNGGDSDPKGPVNVLVRDNHIVVVSPNPVPVETTTMVIDGNGRFIMGTLTIGKKANLLVVEGDPTADITILASPNSAFLVMRNGRIENDVPQSVVSHLAPKAGESAPVPTPKATAAKQQTPLERLQRPWNTYENDYFSTTFVAAVLLDRTKYDQDSKGKAQVGSLSDFDTGEVRATRVGVVGTVKLFDDPWKYILAGSTRAFDSGFDTDTDQEWAWYDWAIGIPLYGGAEARIGKQKENISHDRLMSLIDQPFMERASLFDAFLPSRNTGVVVLNDAFDQRATWSLGAFFDMFGERNDPSTESKQYIARVSAVPLLSDDEKELLHIGLGVRYSDSADGIAGFGITPEAFFGPRFVDTGIFPASSYSTLTLEGGWRSGPVWLQSEYVRAFVESPETNDVNFNGFHITGAWTITGETRGYNRRHGVFTTLVPATEVTNGGAGAWEAVARYSYIDLNDGPIEGGDMARWSLGLNWYPTRTVKVTAQYGLIDLDRFDEQSYTHVFQTRLVILLL
jgi:phosphate-selective porin OprO/OprP